MNLCKVHPTLLNEVPVQNATVVAHNDVFTVADRLFRVEFPHGSPSRVLQLVSDVCFCMLEKKTLAELNLTVHCVVIECFPIYLVLMRLLYEDIDSYCCGRLASQLSRCAL